MLDLNPMGVVRKAKRKMKSQRTLRILNINQRRIETKKGDVNQNGSVTHEKSVSHKVYETLFKIVSHFRDAPPLASQNGFDPHCTDVSISHRGVVTHTEDASHVDNETHLNVASHIGHETYGRIANYREAIFSLKPIECVRSHEKIECQALNVSHPVSESRGATANQHNESHMLNVIQEIFAIIK
ncbi:hypothetical protein J7L33_01250 [Candidatus Bathyarchaeota archaeon]|nr:hypothetical protein [Candidatus Bathyarchaeota archaeon]